MLAYTADDEGNKILVKSIQVLKMKMDKPSMTTKQLWMMRMACPSIIQAEM